MTLVPVNVHVGNGSIGVSLEGDDPLVRLQAAGGPAGVVAYYEQPNDPGVVAVPGSVWFDTDDIVLPGPLGPTRGSVLPSAPVDGQEHYYQPAGFPGVLWHLIYNATSPSAFKWEWAGGSMMRARNTAVVTLAAAVNTPESIGVSLTAPLAGEYAIGFGSSFNNDNINAYMNLEVYVNGLQGWGITYSTPTVAYQTGNNQLFNTLYYEDAGAADAWNNPIPAGCVLELKVRRTPATGVAKVYRTRMSLRPVRCG
jgi:hypothetical protein